MALVVKTCPKCRTVLDATNYIIRPGVVQTVTCHKCGEQVLLTNDPSFRDASVPRKIFYGLAFIKTIFIIGVPAVLCIQSISEGYFGYALVFGGVALVAGFIFTR